MPRIFLQISVLIFLACVWLWYARRVQLSPHHIVSSVNGQVLSDFWTTNPVYLKYYAHAFYSTNGGVEYRMSPQTNYYWNVWRVFR